MSSKTILMGATYLTLMNVHVNTDKSILCSHYISTVTYLPMVVDLTDIDKFLVLIPKLHCLDDGQNGRESMNEELISPVMAHKMM